MTTINLKENKEQVLEILNITPLYQYNLPQNLIELLEQEFEEGEVIDIELKISDSDSQLIDIRIFDPLHIIADEEDILINKNGWSNWFNGSIF